MVPALVHAGIIYLLSDRALPRLLSAIGHLDKVGHMAIFALLALLVAWGLFRVFPAWPTGKVLLLALLVSVAYGASDELHQRYVRGRTPDVMDLAADGAGAGAVVAVLWWRRRGGAGPVGAPGRPGEGPASPPDDA